MIKARERHKRIRDFQLIVMAAAGIVFLAVFAYLPMFGIALAFKDGDKALNIMRPLLLGTWTLDNFRGLFMDETFWQVLANTLTINILLLIFNFPMPILFALLMNEVNVKFLKKGVQTLCNIPHFISWVVYGGIIISLTNPSTGVVNPILEVLGLSTAEHPIDLNLAKYFYPKIIIASILKGIGWGSIIYSAAIAGINPELYEAAVMDGAGRWRRAWNITVPMIKPTIIIFLLLNMSNLLSNSFEQFYVFQTTENLETTRVLATYTYNVGFTWRNYSTSTAISLFEGLVSVVLLLSSNFLAKRLTGEGIF